MNASPRLRITSLIVASLLSGVPARAQELDPSTLPTAQALFDAATMAMDAGDYATACPKLEEVVRLVPDGMGAKLTLARCYEGAGKLASAWTLYSVVEASAPQKERVKLAGMRAAALRPRLAALTIQVPEAVRTLPGLEIRRDGTLMGRAQWGVALPVDTGSYVLSATATGKRRWEQTVRVEADGAKIEVEIAPLEDAAESVPGTQAVAPAAAAPRGGPRASRPPAPEMRPETWGAQRIGGVVAGAAGLVGLGVGTVFGIRAMTNANDAEEHCHDENLCDKTGFDAMNAARQAGDLSTAFFIGGAVALAGGVTLFLTAPTGGAETRAAVVAGPRGVVVRGAF